LLLLATKIVSVAFLLLGFLQNLKVLGADLELEKVVVGICILCQHEVGLFLLLRLLKLFLFLFKPVYLDL
jgi:hypothetical protein